MILLTDREPSDVLGSLGMRFDHDRVRIFSKTVSTAGDLPGIGGPQKNLLGGGFAFTLAICMLVGIFAFSTHVATKGGIACGGGKGGDPENTGHVGSTPPKNREKLPLTTPDGEVLQPDAGKPVVDRAAPVAGADSLDGDVETAAPEAESGTGCPNGSCPAETVIPPSQDREVSAPTELGAADSLPDDREPEEEPTDSGPGEDSNDAGSSDLESEYRDTPLP